MLHRSVQRLLLVCLLATPLGACMFGRGEPKPSWRTTEVTAVTEHVLWLFATDVLKRQGFPVGTGANPVDLTVRTGWRSDLAAFSGDGRRRFAELKLVPLGDKRWEVSVRVATQANMALANPLNPRYAEWEWREDDETRADVLLQAIRSSIQTPLELNSEEGELP